MKKLLLLSFSVFCILLSNAQFKRCYTHELMVQKENQNPGYMQRVNDVFENAKQIATQNRNSRAVNDTIYHVQVVFHVVYTSAAENIPDSVLINQIEVLNRDYRRRNADTVQTRACFQPIAADAGIEFYLATTDPDGNPTNGITRTVGHPQIPFLGFNPGSDEIKDSANGKTCWPTDRYLNIWVGNVFFGIVLGYAFPPDNAPNWPGSSGTDSAHQGVVLHYAAVGSNFAAPIDPTVAGGRSAVHEIGHYFGLRHIWGDSTDCVVDDGISDTPFAADASQQTCDTTVNSCVDSPVDFPDMIEDYMDYSDDRCLNMFTQEQIGVMRAMLATSRVGVAYITTGTTEIKNMATLEGVEVFPNPSNGIFKLTAKGKEELSFEVYNAVGEKVIATQSFSSSATVNLSSFSAGIYFAKISSGENVAVKRLVINK